MTAARDPRDLDQVFGDVRRDDDGEGLRISAGRNEAELRRNLASAAHAYGWFVEEEVVVPGWGRIDIVLRDGVSAPLLIELKLDLIKPAQVRRAFQQTDGYGRWWTQERGEAADTLLVGLRVDWELMASVHRAYPSVGWGTAGSLLRRLQTRGDDRARILRRRRSADRLRTLRALAKAYEAAIQQLPPDPAGDVFGALEVFDQFQPADEDGAA
jgi:hypothetical protein